MYPTRKERAQIRAHWPLYDLRFKRNGQVVASRDGGAYGLLYTREQLNWHVNHIRAVPSK